MIVARLKAVKPGKQKVRILLGLSAENVKRLQEGEPLDVPAESLEACGISNLAINIYVGDTEESMARDLRARFGVQPQVPEA